MMYSKLFSSLVHSSLWSEPDHIRLLFITLLAIADRDGIVYGSRSGLERAAMIDMDAAQEIDPWVALMGPDSDSSDLMRNPQNEGRRIEEIPGGFKIINYTYYKSLRDSEDRKVQNREAQRRHRDKLSPRKPASSKVSRRKPIESEIEIEKKEGANGSRPQSVEDWLKELISDKTYAGIDVRREYGKMLNWCNIRHKQATKRRFVNWLNNVDRPVSLASPKHPVYGGCYLPPRVELTDEELARQRKIVREASAKLRDELKK